MAKLLSGRLKELNVGIKSYSENATTFSVIGISSLSNVILNGSVSAGGTTGTNEQYLRSTGVGVTWSSLSSIRSSNTYTATPGQTTFSLSYSVGLIDLYVNGVRLTESEYTASNGTSIILNEGLFGGESVDIIAYTSFGSVSSPAIGNSEADTLDSVTGRGGTTSNNISVGILTASSFIKTGGTSSQFLKADGSIDSSTYATQTSVGLATSGLLSTTGNGSSLTGIVTYIEAGAGISIDQNTGKVTITNTGGGGGGGIVGLTVKDENVTVGTAGSVTTLNFVGDNITAISSGSISTITIATQTYIQSAGIATYSSTSGISTYSTTAGISTYATTAGISTVSQGLTGTPNISVGIVTASSYNGSGSNLIGIVTYITAGSGISVNQNTNNVTITNTGPSLSGNNTFTGINTFSGSNSFTGSIIIEQASESFNKYSSSISSGGTISLNCSSGNIHYITSTVSGNWTANLTNVGVNSGYCANYTLVISQGTTAYIPSTLQIDGVSQTINWQGGSQPTGNNSKKDVIAYTIFNDGGVYTVFAQLVTFG